MGEKSSVVSKLKAQLAEQKEEFSSLTVKHTKLAHNKKTKHMADRF